MSIEAFQQNAALLSKTKTIVRLTERFALTIMFPPMSPKFQMSHIGLVNCQCSPSSTKRLAYTLPIAVTLVMLGK